jgi:hypothetical protein
MGGGATKLSVNIEAILECAKKAGVSVAVRAKLRAELEREQNDGKSLIDENTSHARKALSYMTEQNADFLPRATELQGRLLLGQWKIVADEVEWLARQLEKANPDGAGVYDRVTELRHFARMFKGTEESRGSMSTAGANTLTYEVHQAANVLACSLKDCGSRECWASRRWCLTTEEEAEQNERWRREWEEKRVQIEQEKTS